MKTFIAAAAFGAASSIAAASSSQAWINEIHYDNDGADTGEFVELVVADGVDLSQLTLTLYNGANGSEYNAVTADTFSVGESVAGFTVLWFDFPTNGIQNGAPDGMTLDLAGVILEAIAYEGSFVAADGVAAGLNLADIGVEQTGSTPVGASIGLVGTGTSKDAFTWTNFDSDTRGFLNLGQAIPAPGAAALLGLAGLSAARRRRA